MDNKLVCRVCLKPEQSQYISLYDTYKKLLLFEYINAITRVNIKHNDGFPDKICEYCFKQLKTAINFSEKCEESNNYLKDILLKGNVCNGNNSIKSDDCKDNGIKLEEVNQEEYLNYSDLSDKECEDVNTTIVIESLSLPCSRKPEDKKVQCHDCGNIFNSKCKLRVHWKREHMLKNLICNNCKRTFKSYNALRSHKVRKTKSCSAASDKLVSITGLGRNRMFSCKECNYKTGRIKDIATHIVIHSGERPFQCDLCPKNFTQHNSLQCHKECAHADGNAIMTCHFCGKYIKGRRNLQRHIKGHTDKKLPCTICKKVITRISYSAHMKRHSGVKSFTCEKCASTFYTSAELCNHKRWVHVKKGELFKCDLCDYKCAKPYNLKLHKGKHTDKNFACKFCGRFYLSQEKLFVHERSHSDEKKFSCPQCNAKFFNRYSVTKHMKTKHSLAYIGEKVMMKENKEIVKTQKKELIQIDIKTVI